jgi:hypothetical protein
MANTTRNFTQGKMNKMVDERLVPNGEYIDALNVRMGSTEGAEIGVIENSKGNDKLTTIRYNGTPLSDAARCIGAYEDSANETIYWFVHDPTFEGAGSPTGIVDMICSYNTISQAVTYHVISVDDGSGTKTTLNFDPDYLITGVDFVDNRLLFFTDNTNPPRKINVNFNYGDPTNGLDGFTYDEIMVIKKPPTSSPNVRLLATAGESTYMEDRFLCFGYRYKYNDDEYSATSQYSTAAFTPGGFLFSPDSYLNEGMINFTNTAEITFNSGGPLVKGIDLLFKDNDSNVVKIIEKLDKVENAYNDNQDYTYTFTNSKIFTILPEAEILRLFDNVPRLAKAQTLMGNRLMYGNYVEGYDLIDYQGNPTRLTFFTTQTNDDIGLKDVDDGVASVNYSIGPSNTSQAQFEIDFPSDIELVSGAAIQVTLKYKHESFNGTAPFPVEETPEQEIGFIFNVNQNFNSVYEYATSQSFQDQVGTLSNIKPLQDAADPENNSCNGTTFTDVFYCSIPSDLDLLNKFDGGISTGGPQPIQIEASPGSNTIGLKLPAVQFVDDIATPTQNVYEYFEITFGEVVYAKIGVGESLHSNRGYEVGMVYMDEFNRATPTLVSLNNTEHFPCGMSYFKNSIQVTIPTTQIAPSWAKRYKFVVKPDKEKYETIYTNIFFEDPNTSAAYFLLEGENSSKITEGQRLIVKTDTEGPLTRCVTATVLEKESKTEDFLEIPVEGGGADEFVPQPSGTYMKINTTQFNAEVDEGAVVDFGKRQTTADRSDHYPLVKYPVNLDGADPDIPGSSFTDYDVPAGSRIVFDFYFRRIGRGDGNNACERRTYELSETYAASSDYDNFMDWFNGDNIGDTLDNGVGYAGDNSCPPANTYLSTLLESDLGDSTSDIPQDLCTNYYQFYRNNTSNQLLFLVRGTRACSRTKKQRSLARIKITVFRAEDTIVFESEPIDSSPDIWYEGADSFPIISNSDSCVFSVSVDASEPSPIAFNYVNLDGVGQQVICNPSQTITEIFGRCGTMTTSATTPPVDPTNITIDSEPAPQGSHVTDIQPQTSTQAGIVNTGLFNCYSFGNGVESYKVRDSLLGKELVFGNRVTSTQALDYQEIRRFADITYSGVFNDESNINRLNEFNGGLLNFKALEESFGPIEKLFARETDVLTLQEDKISYVLSGKNLLSDAGTGSLLQSVPEVLGTQIARIEEFGISNNPESFVQWGPEKYFTDAKRGVVLMLSGTSYTNDSLMVISSFGMRSWFRDLFNTQVDTQKLGGYDPYMNEFVLSANNISLPIEEVCIECGITGQYLVQLNNELDNCYELGTPVGQVDIVYNIINITGNTVLTATYNGVAVSTGPVTTSGTLSFDKSLAQTTTFDLNVVSSGSVEIEFIVNCPEPKEMAVVYICATSDLDSDDTIHNDFSWEQNGYQSPINSQGVTFLSGAGNPVVSYYQINSGVQGVGSIPPDGSTVTMAFNKYSQDDATFDLNTNKFRFLRSNTLYANTPQAVAQAIAASSVAAPIDSSLAPDYYKADFTVPNGNEQYLYIIYDYRTPTAIDLCRRGTLEDSCCNCDETPT